MEHGVQPEKGIGVRKNNLGQTGAIDTALRIQDFLTEQSRYYGYRLATRLFQTVDDSICIQNFNPLLLKEGGEERLATRDTARNCNTRM